MLILFVYGVPEDMPEENLGKASEALREAVAAIPGLELNKSSVSCFFPRDRLSLGLGEEIIIFVDGLFDWPKRTPKVREELATAIVRTAEQHFDHSPLHIECFVRPFNPESGFRSIMRS